MDNVENFVYLGTTLNFNGSFYKTQSVLALQSIKAMFYLFPKMKPLHLNIDTELSFFDTCNVRSIIRYTLWL